MKFLLYLIMCLNVGFGQMVGVSTESVKEENMLLVGLIVIVAFVLVVLISNIVVRKLTKNSEKLSKHTGLLTLAASAGVVVVFCAVCIVVELIIN